MMRLRTHAHILLIVGVLTVGVTACQGRDEPQEETAGEEATSPAQHMQEHFTQAVAFRDAVIDGDLTAAQEPARWMAEHQMEGGLPEGWDSYVAEMQAAAAGAVGSMELDAAGRAAGTMAAQCGTCHQAQNAMIDVSIGDPPAAEPGTEAHMARHLWAMERLWEGLVIPSDAAWAAGSDVLADEPLGGGSFSDDPQLQAELAELAGRIHALGAEAATVQELSNRGHLYGQMLATCAPCHTRVAGMLP
jgi:cytochrome c553